MKKRRFLFEEEKLTSREKKIKKLKEMTSENNEAAKDLYGRVCTELGELFVEYPDYAYSYQIKRYNKLVMSSELPFIIRKKLRII